MKYQQPSKDKSLHCRPSAEPSSAFGTILYLSQAQKCLNCWRTEKLYSITCSIQTFSSTFCFSSSVSTLSASIVVLKTPVWKLMKRYCCVFLYMFSLSACVRSCVQGTWENQIFIIAPFFNTVLANQNHHAQSFLANSNILPCNVRGHYRSPLTFPGFHSIFHRTTMMQAFGSLLIFRKWVLTFSRH